MNILVSEDLQGGRYYDRWIEVNDIDIDSARLACNCGYRSDWNPSYMDVRDRADEIHRGH